MATLTETAYYTRKGVKITIGLIIGIVVLKFIWGIAGQIWLALFPPPPAPATVAFGLLPKIQFPKTDISSSSAKFTYTLETVDGKLPKFPINLEVYFIPKPGSSFGGYEKMMAQAQRMGFTVNPEPVFGEVDKWIFTDTVLPLRHLEYNATTGTFRLYYDYRFDLNLFARKNFTTQEQIISDAVSFYGNLGLLPADLVTGQHESSYFKLTTSDLTPATSLFEADAARVNFYRADIIKDKKTYPVVPPDPNKSLVSVLFSGSDDQNKKILEAVYYYLGVDYENYATYPLMTAELAYEALKKGQAYVAAAPKTPGRISIRKIILGYFDSNEPQSYLQPVVIFSDEKGFEAYVPAISPNLYQP